MKNKDILLGKMLGAGQNGLQLVIGSVGLVLGLTVMLTSWQLYINIQEYLDGEENQGNYLVLNKQVSIANTIFMSSNTFKESEIEELKQQPFIEDLTPFVSSQFESSIFSKSFNFYTHVFFEAVPDRFVGELPPGWTTWQEGQPVPIMISRDFLNLYNFGFALSRGLPQLSESSFKMLDLTLRLRSKNGQSVDIPAKIAGFTSRVSSLMVPMDFMEYANNTFAPDQEKSTGRLMVKVVNRQDPKLLDYLDDKAFVTSEELSMAKRADQIANAAFSGAIGLGLLFMLLSFVLFALVIRLSIAESKSDISKLLQLGYRQQELSKVLMKRYLILLLSIIVGCLALSYGLFKLSQSILESKGISLGSYSFSTPLLGFLMAGFSIGFIYWVIRKQVSKASV